MNRNGFFLIKFLIVVCIIGLFCYFIGPHISNNFKNFTEKGAKENVFKIVSSAKLQYTSLLLNTANYDGNTENNTFICKNKTCKSKNGKKINIAAKVESGTITISDGGVVNGKLKMNKKHTFYICENNINKTNCDK